MPIIPEVNSTLDKIRDIHKRKNDDYANSDNPFYNFDIQEFFSKQLKSERDKVFANMVGLKFARIANLLACSANPNNESIIDSFDDFATYVILWKADYMRRVNGKIKTAALSDK